MGEVHGVTVDFIRQGKAAGRTKLVFDLQDNGGGQIPSLAMLYFHLFPGHTLPLQSRLRAHPQLAWLLHQTNTTTRLPWLLNICQTLSSTPWPSPQAFYGPASGNLTSPSFLSETAYFPSSLLPYTLPWPTPPFLLLTSGSCTSACALLVSALTHTHGIRTLALGGCPLHAPMQAVGRTKGGPAADFASFPALDRGTAPMRIRGGVGMHFNLANVAPRGG
ncbi:hypothetical protein B0T25DRAFT_519365 [Lasiosphaeria hispida]|uniref:Tail specific protease domain-containing protein n=1 Tax=Lasiosphaeria hispida TaxID=260671 RepID=A0AAJ0MBY2_9PEZI|nr:hypothetical protein B0T25DRAFT_519365 [Lasiosphaeria hispida]